MTKRQAVAYAQVTLDRMLRSDYKEKLNLENFGMEMRRVYKTFHKRMILDIARGQLYAERRLTAIRNGSTSNGKK